MAHNQWIGLAFLVVLLLVPGCGGGGGDGVSTTTVTGTVHYNGGIAVNKPVYLVNGAGGQNGPVNTGSDGEFVFTGVVPGSYQASCQVAPGVTLTCPEAGGQYRAVTLNGSNDFSIGQDAPPGPPTE